MRVFAAVVPPPPVIEHLDSFLDVRRPHGEFRWASAEQLHVTLAFAERASEQAVDEWVERLSGALARRAPFEAAVAGGGAFPDVARAKVLWAGLATDGLAPLAVNARNTAVASGIEVDGRRFRPHVTLARLGRPADVAKWVRLLDAYRGPAWPVTSIEVIESHLGEGPRRRPRHEVVAEIPLTGL